MRREECATTQELLGEELVRREERATTQELLTCQAAIEEAMDRLSAAMQ